jgi:pathogenesis-related protein 1
MIKLLPVFLILLLFICGSSPKNDEPANMKGMVARHNYWREKVGVPPITWSNELAVVAGKWAKELKRKGCEMEHSPRSGKFGTGYGENLYWSSGMQRTPEHVVDSWASEIEYYNSSTGKCNGGVCGHYTQIVWSKTTAIGCAMEKCGDEEIWVCNYNPPGNYVGQKPY